MTTVMKHRCNQVITKLLFGAAIALCPGVTGAAPASAHPHSVGSDPNPFSTLSYSRRETAPADSPVWRDEVKRGIQEGLVSVATTTRPLGGQKRKN
jgi:hypothetical protein